MEDHICFCCLGLFGMVCNDAECKDTAKPVEAHSCKEGREGEGEREGGERERERERERRWGEREGRGGGGGSIHRYSLKGGRGDRCVLEVCVLQIVPYETVYDIPFRSFCPVGHVAQEYR